MSKYTQAFHNPLTKSDDYEVITVRRVRNNTKVYNPDLQQEAKQDDLFLSCSDARGVLKMEKGTLTNKFNKENPKNYTECHYCT